MIQVIIVVVVVSQKLSEPLQLPCTFTGCVEREKIKKRRPKKVVLWGYG
jgi:hypothetical protein